MTGLLGRRCTRGNALSPPLLMAEWLGFLFRAFFTVCAFERHASVRCDPTRPPGKIEVHHTCDCAASIGRTLSAQLSLGGKGEQPFGFPSRPWCFLRRCLSLHSECVSILSILPPHPSAASFRRLSHLNLWMAQGRIEADDTRDY